MAVLLRYYGRDPLDYDPDEFMIYRSGVNKYENLIRPKGEAEIVQEMAEERMKEIAENRKKRDERTKQ